MKLKHLVSVLLFALFVSACKSEEPSGCNRPPKEGFSESDLIGTWDASGSQKNSTIIIQENGRYKQILSVERTGFKYESDWLPWKVTYSDKGLPYLHLEGLLMCAYWYGMDCTQTVVPTIGVGDTKDPFGDATFWYDFCQGKWVNTPGKGVYMVLGYEVSPRGIALVPLTKSSDTPTGPGFIFREP